MKHKGLKIFLSIILCLALLIGASFMIFGIRAAYPYRMFYKGNSSKYSTENVSVNPDSKLNGKTVIFLGSSITDGYGSVGETFADYLKKCDGVNTIKEAVSGTTLVDNGKKSYVQRLKTIPTDIKADAFVCQLSTNDATKNMPLGEIGESKDIASFDTNTVAGAIEYIIAYVNEAYGCSVFFYTSPEYESENYQKMVDLLYKIQAKWDINIIDLWNNESVNTQTQQNKKLYMIDDIHPTKAGYYEVWLPVFEKELSEKLK